MAHKYESETRPGIWAWEEEDYLVSWFHERASEEYPTGMRDVKALVCRAYDAIRDVVIRNGGRRTKKEIVIKLLQLHDQYWSYRRYAEKTINRFDSATKKIIAGKGFSKIIDVKEIVEEKRFKMHGVRNYYKLEYLFQKGGCMYQMDDEWLLAAVEKGSKSDGPWLREPYDVGSSW